MASYSLSSPFDLVAFASQIYNRVRKQYKFSLKVDVKNYTDLSLVDVRDHLTDGKMETPPTPTIAPDNGNIILSRCCTTTGFKQAVNWRLEGTDIKIKVQCGIGLKDEKNFLRLILSDKNLPKDQREIDRVEVDKGKDNRAAHVSGYGYTVIGTMGTGQHIEVIIEIRAGERRQGSCDSSLFTSPEQSKAQMVNNM